MNTISTISCSIVLVVLALACEEQKEPEPSLPSDQEAYAFLETVVPVDSSGRCKVFDRDSNAFRFTVSDSLELEKLDGLLSDRDLTYMNRQMPQTTSFRLKGLYFRGRQIISADSTLREGQRPMDFWRLFKKRYGENACYAEFTKPLFSLDKSVAVFRMKKMCGPDADGEGSICIYKKKNGKWQLIKEIGGWQT